MTIKKFRRPQAKQWLSIFVPKCKMAKQPTSCCVMANKSLKTGVAYKTG